MTWYFVIKKEYKVFLEYLYKDSGIIVLKRKYEKGINLLNKFKELNN